MKPILGVGAALAALYALQHQLALLAVLLMGAVWVIGRLGTRVVTVRTAPGDRRHAAVHEAGHLAVGREVNADVLWARLCPDGSGVAKVRTYDTRSDIAVYLGGAAAAGSDAGAEYDYRMVAAALETVPASERDQLLADARGDVRRALASRAHEVARDAEILERRGWI